jgi:hypothetical protein
VRVHFLGLIRVWSSIHALVQKASNGLKTVVSFVVVLSALTTTGCTPYLVGTDDLSLLIKTTPQVVDVTTSKANGIYKAGTVIPITVNFSEAVVVTGVPQLQLNVTPTTLVSYGSGSGTGSITFNYTIGTNDAVVPSLDYQSSSALILNGGTIRSLLNVDAEIELPVPNSGKSLAGTMFAKLITIDTVLPVGPTGIFWTGSSPRNSTSLTANWTASTSGDVSAQKLRLFQNGNCTEPATTVFDYANAVTNVQTITGVDAMTYSFKVRAIDLAGNEVDSACSSAMVVDMSTPTIAIASPVSGTWINLANNSASFMVSGTCSEVNRTVTIKSGATTLGTATCTGTLFSGTINATTLAAGLLSLTATISDAAGNAANSSVSVTKDVIAPTASTSHAWSQTSPFNATTVIATWSKSVSTDLANQKIQFYASPTCGTGTESGSLITLNNSAQSQSFTGADGGTYTYQITSIDNAGNPTVSSCSSAMTIDTTAPTAPTNLAWTQTSPHHSTSVTASWTKSGSADLASQKIQFYNGATCNSGTENGALMSLSAAAQTQALTGSHAATYAYQITSTDSAGNSTVSACSTSMLIDTVSPIITAGSYIIAGGATVLNNNNTTVAIQASDATSNITHLCLKTSNAAVTTADSCWVAMAAVLPGQAASNSITVTSYNYNFGIPGGLYTIYAYVRDAAGNISSLTNSGNGTINTDRYDLTYTQGQAAVLTYLNGTNSNTSTFPPAQADLQIASGQSVFIKWRAEDDFAIPAQSVKLYYTTDDVNFTVIASNLNNGANPGTGGQTCTVSGNYTGCFVWTPTHTPAPLTTYFKVRFEITDSNGFITQSSAQPNNVSTTFKFIAGNTDPGIGGSARAAVIGSKLYTSEAYFHGLAVASNGVTYFYDNNNSKLYIINPADGSINTLGRVTGNTTGDGGPVTSATFTSVRRLTVDFQDGLLIADQNRVRRVDPVTGIITTFIGGGASTADGTSATSFSMENQSDYASPFLPLPNGDFIFTSSGMFQSFQVGMKLSRYKASDGKIYSIQFTGIGKYSNSTDDISYCPAYGIGFGYDVNSSNFNAVQFGGYGKSAVTNGSNNCIGGAYAHLMPTPTGAATETYTTCTTANCHNDVATGSWMNYVAVRQSGMDGYLYAYGYRMGAIYKYFPDLAGGLGSWTRIVGNDVTGQSCADGDVATSCSIAPISMFVNKQGTVFFMDVNRIRTVDASGRIQTLYGQSLAYGDGAPALSARFNFIQNISRRTNGDFVTMDTNEFKIREFTVDGNINTIAGNGVNTTPAFNTNATQVGLRIVDSNGDFDINPATGDVFYMTESAYRVLRLRRTTNQWENFIAGTGTDYTVADGLQGANITLASGYRQVRVLGYNTVENKLLLIQGKYAAFPESTQNYHHSSMLKLYAESNATQSHLAGTTANSPATICASGTLGSACAIPTYSTSYWKRMHFDSVTNKWFMPDYGGVIRTFAEGGTVDQFSPNAISANAAGYGFAMNRNGANIDFYWCNAPTGGSRRIFKMTLASDGSLVSAATQLPWPISNMHCDGRSMVYENGKLTFIYMQNGLMGVAQYLNP